MKKRLSFLLPTLGLAVCLLAGCGSAASAAASTPPPEPTPVPTAEPTPTPEPEPVPYAEEHALEFAPAEDFSVTSVMWVTDDRSQFREFDAPFHFEGVELTDNGDGTETIAVSYTVTGTASVNLQDRIEYTSCTTPSLVLWDMYSGLTIGRNSEKEIEWQGEQYALTAHSDDSFEWGGWQTDAEGIWANQNGVEQNTQYISISPALRGMMDLLSMSGRAMIHQKTVVFRNSSWTTGQTAPCSSAPAT